ncbi:hypothetical protein AQS8620_01482 [Aquimixticola soesokkakensis]|uniref:Tetratricopeptide repeat protein n=1 Tax=Aquimixticola soesokkakensis TaxID=1519096 RepID=A0A1Y5SKC2_9RHOB|nr:hypothetical protein [Aquimixticola soesokkakensis]SLN39666.1 hypothetical protein AQS8620_01482 [Aquimixticola soesokkakensis]
MMRFLPAPIRFAFWPAIGPAIRPERAALRARQNARLNAQLPVWRRLRRLHRLHGASSLLALCLCLPATSAVAQASPPIPAAVPATGEAPLSAIDWLSDSVAAPQSPTASNRSIGTTGAPDPLDLATNALPENVTVRALDAPDPNAAGLLPPSVTGLPADLWGASDARSLARQISDLSQRDLLPAAQRLFHTLLLAELDPPALDPDAILLIARLDALLEMGALDEAEALIERAQVSRPEFFRRWFDVKLLLGTENQACARLDALPNLSPTYPARIFCLARGGRWDAAAVTLATAEALDLISAQEDALITKFLDPDLFDEASELDVPQPLTPLAFRMLEAVGEPIPTNTLPLAFAQSDLRDVIGWRARIIASERLARAGALDANRWLGIWTEAGPAASGGIWDRVSALQNFERALSAAEAGTPEALDGSLDGALDGALDVVWPAMIEGGTTDPFATLFAARLLPFLDDASALPDHSDIARTIVLLSPDYEAGARSDSPASAPLALAESLALGAPVLPDRPTPLMLAIRDGFAMRGVPERLSGYTQNAQLGEGILAALALLDGNALVDLDELRDALAFLRAAGLEETARRAGIEALLMDRGA